MTADRSLTEEQRGAFLIICRHPPAEATRQYQYNTAHRCSSSRDLHIDGF